MAAAQKVYTGTITEKDYGENYDALFIGDSPEPLASEVVDAMGAHGQYLSVRYFISDQPKSEDELIESLILHRAGVGSAEYEDCYSEATGYLWTNEELQVGGHDLMGELRTFRGKFCRLEISFAHEPPEGKGDMP